MLLKLRDLLLELVQLGLQTVKTLIMLLLHESLLVLQLVDHLLLLILLILVLLAAQLGVVYSQ